MFKYSKFSHRFIQTVVASGLAFGALTAPAADFPVGAYSIDAAKLTLSFDDKGQFRVVNGDKMQVSGKYAIKGDEIRLTDGDGPWACTKDGQRSGTYRWSYEKAILTFSTLVDPCQERVGSLTTVKWKKQP